jgi:type I restriction enzyme S subunit
VRSFGQRTTSISNLNLDRCLALPLNLPSLDEQERIAGLIDRVEILRAKRRATLTRLEELKHRIFTDLFAPGLDGPAVDLSPMRPGLPADWSWQPLTEVARIATGHTPDRERQDYWNGGIPWISLTDIRSLDGTVATTTGQNVSPLGIEHSSSVLLPRGTVCVSRTASVGYVTMMGVEMATSQDFVNWVCGEALDPTYLMWAFMTSRRRLRALSSGSTHKTIYMRVFERLHIVVPPRSTQAEFATRIAGVDRLLTSHTASFGELEALFTSLQDRAFAGLL